MALTLEEVRGRLIEVCKGKASFIDALEAIAEQGMYIGEERFNEREVGDLNMLIRCGGVLCGECPFGEDFVNCDLEVNTSGIEIYEDLESWYSETLNLAIASCKGEEVEETTPADNPSKPLFIVTKVDDLIGLESEDGKFRICRNSNAMGDMYEAIGVKSFFPYYQFEKLNLEAEQILGELGFRFTIQERKSYLELLEECEEVEFDVAGDNHYYVGRDLTTGEVRIGMVTDWYIPGIKYISREDADRIVKECVENA